MPFEVEVQERIGEIVFNHPPVNAFDSAMWLELPDIVYGLAPRTRAGQRPAFPEAVGSKPGDPYPGTRDL